MRLLGLKFKSDNKIKSKAVKHILTMRWKIKTRVRSYELRVQIRKTKSTSCRIKTMSRDTKNTSFCTRLKARAEAIKSRVR